MTTGSTIPDSTCHLQKFKKVYADACLFDIPLESWTAEKEKAAQETAMQRRELTWKGERMPLAEAAKLYAEIPGYNNFQPNMLSDLFNEFKDQGEDRKIEATPAREMSVAVYLHVPLGLRRQVRVFVEKNFEADEVEWVAPGDTLRVWWD